MSPAVKVMKKYYSFAGVDVCVELPSEKAYTQERQLSPFHTESLQDPHYYRFEIVQTLDPPAGESVEGENQLWRDGETVVRYMGAPSEPYMRAEHNGREHSIQLREKDYPREIGVKTVLNALLVEHLAVEAGSVLLHCAYIDAGGQGILFTAPSGTGKSTQAELWRKFRDAEIINGDRAAIRFYEGEALAMGIPFCGSSTYCENRTLPLRAIVYLGQAPETTIRSVKGFAAFRRIWEGCSVNSWDRNNVEKATEILMNILDRVPVFLLNCTPDESAVLALERALQEV